MECHVCHTEASGPFCPKCGAPLEGASCSVCEAPFVPGARFCTGCGAAVRESTVAIPWLIAGASLIALILVLLVPELRDTGGARSFGPVVPPLAGEPVSPPPLTGTPRDQADRLFNRIMQEQAEENAQQVAFFLPMAMTAYRQAGPLDADGLYHLSLLETMADELDAARASAELILESAPDHLLGLAAAAEAAAGQGDSTAARGYYRRLLDVFDAESERPLPEYQDHARVLPGYRRAAEEMLAR